MNVYRKTARIAGVLFITATVASILSLPFLGPINASNYLTSISANGNLVTVGALLALSLLGQVPVSQFRCIRY